MGTDQQVINAANRKTIRFSATPQAKGTSSAADSEAARAKGKLWLWG
jgi:hypothetical protein